MEQNNKKGRPFPDISSPIFVVQKHKASRLHYDFRLEVGDVLVSWAVPKGPSISQKDKRFAIRVDDHILSYGDFEGRIPKGNYGAGTVIIWDHGKFECNQKTPDLKKALESGQLKIILHGQKLKGGWALVKMKDGDKNWLLIKEKDQYADEKSDIVFAKPESTLSGKLLEDVEKDPNSLELSCESFG